MTDNKLTLLAVHAHPDDESIGTGGILAKYGTQDVRTVLTYCTRGEAGDILNPDFVNPPGASNIVEIRAIELNNALKVLDVRDVHFLGYRDSGMAGTEENHNPEAFARADVEEAVGRLVDIIRQTKPQVIVTYNEKGNYGHPDHIMANRVTVRAFQAAGDPGFKTGRDLYPWQPAKLYYTATPLSRLQKMYDLAVERGEAPRMRPDFMGTPDDQITATVDIREFLDRKMEALYCHQSQFNPNSFFRRVPDELREQFMGYEHFVCVRGCVPQGEKETDLFQGLR